MNRQRLGFIGGGNMGAAIISGVVEHYRVAVCDKERKCSSYLKRRHGVEVLGLKGLVVESEMIVLAVKPQNFDDILKEVSKYLKPKQLVISIAAGMSTKYIEENLPGEPRVIRVMPNLPVQVGLGMTGISKGTFATRANIQEAKKIFEHVGKTVLVEEPFLDIITAVSGSGPAYYFYMVEVFIKAAQSLGLDKNLSETLVLQTLKGSVNLLESSRDSVDVWKSRVTSKGGTTQAALNVFKNEKMDRIFKDALKAAKQRAEELTKK